MTRMLLVIMPAAALMSAFTHHVTITALLLPVMLSLARERQIAPSKLLMPMAIGSSLGTTITIIGAPSFLVASELLREPDGRGWRCSPLRRFGIALTVAGTLYMALVGRLLVPERRGSENPEERFRLDDYVTEVAVLDGSPFAARRRPRLSATRTTT